MSNVSDVMVWVLIGENIRLRRRERDVRTRLRRAENDLAFTRRRYRDLHRQWRTDVDDRERLRRALRLLAQGGYAWKPSASPVLMAGRALKGEDIEDERRKR